MRPKQTRKTQKWNRWWTVAGIGLWAGCQGATEPTAPGGGQPVVLDAAVFADRIEPILQQRGCSNVACHGGQGAGELLLSGGLDVDGDLVAVRGLVTTWQPEDSPLLQKPLAESAGGITHSGGDIFADVDDADYRTVLAWIRGEVLP